MVKFSVVDDPIGVNDIDQPAARTATTKSEGRIRQEKARRLGDFPPPLRQALLKCIDAVLDSVEPLDDLTLEIADPPSLHMSPYDTVAPSVKGGTEVFGIGHANLPMRPSTAPSTFLAPNQQTLVFPESFSNISHEISRLLERLPFSWLLLCISPGSTPHIGQVESIALQPDASPP